MDIFEIVRLLHVSTLPNSVGMASSFLTSVTGNSACAGIAQQIVDRRLRFFLGRKLTCLLPLPM